MTSAEPSAYTTVVLSRQSMKLRRTIWGKKTCSSTGCLKSKNSDIILVKEKILNRWAEYLSESFEDQRKDYTI